MSKIKFPPLHKGLTKYGETFVVSDYIHVKDYHALICHPDYIIVVDLEALFSQKKNPDADPDYVYENMMDILDFLNDKHLSASFWNELVTAPTVMMSDDDDYIIIGSRGTSKELHYIPPTEAEGDEAMIEVGKYIDKLHAAKRREPLGSSKGTVALSTIAKIMAMTGMKEDTLILEHFGESRPMRFSFGGQPAVFGVFANDYEIQELFLDNSLTNFLDSHEENKREDAKKRLSSKELRKSLDEPIADAVGLFQKNMKDLNVEFEIVRNGE